MPARAGSAYRKEVGRWYAGRGDVRLELLSADDWSCCFDDAAVVITGEEEG